MPKYVLLFGGDADYAKAWDSFSEEEKARGMELVGQWFGQHADKLVTTERLADSRDAKRVRFNGSEAPVVTDGPYPEAKETIGGFAIFDLANEAEAVELASTWPARGVVEVRAVAEM